MAERNSKVKVDIYEIDEWYVAKSEDVPGLLLINKDLDKVYEDIPKSIELLLKLNEGIEVEVSEIH